MSENPMARALGYESDLEILDTLPEDERVLLSARRAFAMVHGFTEKERLITSAKRGHFNRPNNKYLVGENSDDPVFLENYAAAVRSAKRRPAIPFEAIRDQQALLLILGWMVNPAGFPDVLCLENDQDRETYRAVLPFSALNGGFAFWSNDAIGDFFDMRLDDKPGACAARFGRIVKKYELIRSSRIHVNKLSYDEEHVFVQWCDKFYNRG